MIISGLSIVLQMAVLTCYHVYPLRRVPNWLRKVAAFVSCGWVMFPSREQIAPLSDHKATTVSESKANWANGSGEHDNPRGLEVITKKIESDTEEGLLRQEWADVARIFDRSFLVIFCFIHLVMILVVLVICPEI